MMKISGSCLALLVFTVSPALAQTNPNSVVRDPNALSLLTRVLAVAGGDTAISSIQDFTATGDITYNWTEPVQASVTVRGRGLHEFRIDAALAGGMRSWVVNNNASFVKNPDGSISALPLQNTAKIASATFPLAQVLWAVQNASVNISDGGLGTHDGLTLHDVVVQEIFPAGTDPAGARSRTTKAHIFIDPNTLTVESIQDTAYSMNGVAAELTHEMRFSGYQAVIRGSSLRQLCP